MSTQAQYASVPKSPSILINTANTNRDGTGTISTLYTAGANGGRVDDIDIAAAAAGAGATTAGMLRFFKYDGSVYRLLFEVSVTAVTPSATVQAFAAQLRSLALVLQATHSLAVSTEKAEAFHITATRCGDF